MASLKEIAIYLEKLLQPTSFKDYCPNGLQVEGRTSIKTIVTGVTANLALIEAAIDADADCLLVHHGYFWKNEPPSIVGMKFRRIKALILNDLSLFAFHLPLDVHPVYGNNVQLAKLLGLVSGSSFETEPGLNLGYLGELSQPLSGKEFAQLLHDKLARSPSHFYGTDRKISKVALCTGGAQDYLLNAIDQEVDAYVTGEVSERSVHIAQENDIHFYVAGHHATERYGIKALGEHLSEQFNLSHYFIDIDNPI